MTGANKTDTPPPGVVFELAERAVEYVRKAVGVVLDYTPDTLPVLDHYLGEVPKDRPEMIALLATAAGAYFGEVARRALGGTWEGIDDPGGPSGWRVALAGDVRFCPVGLAAEAIRREDLEDYDGTYDVPMADRQAVEDALEMKGQVAVEEYYSLSGRLETLMYVLDIVLARRAAGAN